MGRPMTAKKHVRWSLLLQRLRLRAQPQAGMFQVQDPALIYWIQDPALRLQIQAEGDPDPYPAG